MADTTGADSYNFLRSSLSNKQNVLVVGDGNFSFSLSLAIFRDEHGLSTRLVLTSFDSKDILAQDEFTRVNLERLQAYTNVEILHNIDSTKLSEYFPARKFERIIFNFPHTGGKSNIKKCRKLLEDFFVSAVEHVESYDGDICVTLCGGQGGTPVDEPQRTHGNSWQIVNNAAKAGLILHQLHPFLDSDYAHYKSVGYRGKLTKGFHTAGGLIHIFIAGVRLDSIDDLSGKTMDALMSCVCKQYGNISNAWPFSSDHPLHYLKNKILSMLNSVAGTSFQEILENNDSEDVQQDDGVANDEDCLLGYEVEAAVTYNNRILSAMDKSSSFVLTGPALTISDEITCESTVSMRYLAICRFYDSEGENNLGKVDSEKQKIVDEIKKMFSNEHDYFHEVDSGMKVTNIDSRISTWTNSSDVAHLARNKCQLKRKADAEQCTDHTQSKCICERLCRRYLRDDGRVEITQRMPMEFFDQSTVRVFKKRSTVVIICGFPKQEALNLTGNRYGWLILVNLDVLAMVQYNISDIRILSSAHLKWEQKSVVTQEAGHPDKTETFIPVPTNLFPPEHVHDISFWISDDVSQELFFLTTVALTKHCVKEIKLTEIYHDEDKHCLSFNYRMVYSRVDGPLSHLEAVELQNRLRRALIVLGFGLK